MIVSSSTPMVNLSYLVSPCKLNRLSWSCKEQSFECEIDTNIQYLPA